MSGQPNKAKANKSLPAATQVLSQADNQTMADVLRTQAPDIYNAIPPDKREKLHAVLVSSISKYHQGPLPTPEDMAGYNQVISDGANRIMALAERQAGHRQEMEKTVMREQLSESRRGQFFGLAIGILGIVLGAAVAVAGHDTVGGVIAGSTVLGLVAAFLNGQSVQKNQ